MTIDTHDTTNLKILIKINDFHDHQHPPYTRRVNIPLHHRKIRASVAVYARVLAVIRME
jgi:hypothetical protein